MTDLLPLTSLATWIGRHGDSPSLKPMLALLREPGTALPAMAWEVIDTLEHVGADSEVQLAAMLHLHPALRERAASALADCPGLRTLLDGLQAAEQVWSLHARREGRGSAEGLRRLLLAIIRDLRVVLVLLSEQLARLRDASSAPAAERAALAELTVDIHAPLANRLGIWQLKWELEDLAFRYLQPETYQRIARLLDEKRGGRERFIEDAKQKIRTMLAEAGIAADVDGRPKHIFSIWKKMQRKGVDFSELYDIRAIRVLVDDVADCYAALGLVHQAWTPVPAEFDDYIAKPKGNDYRSLHTAVLGADGRPFEVQIRTHAMHEHAELGVAAHWRYKEGGKGEASFERKVAWMRHLLEAREGGDDDTALLAGFSTALLEDRIYLLTPRGEVVDLPLGGTVLDFAYHVHTEVGHRCRGAKVNGRIVPLDYKPASGDQVEILTNKAGEPRRDWLLAANGFLASGRARDKVRAWFHKLDRTRNVQAGKEILERELRRVAMLQADLAPALDKFHLASIEELQVALALGDLGPSQVSRALHEHSQALLQAAAPPKAPERAPKPTARPRSDDHSSRFTVEGVGNLLSQLARCCQPVPGDAIAGYLTKGRGVSIHRRSCASLQRLVSAHPERELPVNWGQAASSRYEVSVQIRAFDRKWLLKDVTNVIAQAEVNILGISSQADESRGLADIRLTLKVGDFEQLSQLLGRLDAVPGVQDARRLG